MQRGPGRREVAALVMGWWNYFVWFGRMMGLSIKCFDSKAGKFSRIQDGSINEKLLVGKNGNFNLALILHATFGLDHFPVTQNQSSFTLICYF
jgi:hypothetical protein